MLLLHGEPSWSYLYRHDDPARSSPPACASSRPTSSASGAPTSPPRATDYTYPRHVDWMTDLSTSSTCAASTLVGQDWGGLIGLRLVAEHPDRFARVVAANTFLPTGDQPLGAGVPGVAAVLAGDAGASRSGGSSTADGARRCPPAVVAAYDAPFPDERYKAGARQFPLLVPTSPDDPAAPAEPRRVGDPARWDKPFLTAFGDSDPITGGADARPAAR